MYINSLRIIGGESTTRLGNRLWVLTKPLIFELYGITYSAPTGFITDGASCPRLLWNICAPVAGPFGVGAIIHDLFYSLEGPDGVSKYTADCVLYTSGVNRNATYIQSLLVYYGVCLFGYGSYKTKVSLDKVTINSCYNYDRALTIIKELRANNYAAQHYNT